MRQQAERYGAELRAERVTQIQTAEGGFRVVMSDVDFLARAVILASGAEYRRLGVPGEERLTGRGVSYCATCDAAFFREMEVAVVGGGDAALDEGLFVARFAAKVHLIHRRDTFRASRVLQERLKANAKVEVIWNTVVESIEGTDEVESVLLHNVVSGVRSQLAVRAVFIFIGQDPNSQIAHNLAPTDLTGHLKVDLQMRTPIAGFFAVGDVREESARQAISAAGVGATAAIAAEHFLTERYGPPTPNLHAAPPARLIGRTLCPLLLRRLLGFLWLGRIGEFCSVGFRPGREAVRPAPSLVDYLLDWDAAHAERVRDQRAVAAPRHRFGTHDGGAALGRQLDQLLDGCPELRRLHVVGVAAKRCIAPARVGRIRPWPAQAAEIRHVQVGDPAARHRLLQGVAVELRIVARARHGAHIYQTLDAVRSQQRDELLGRPGGVPDGEDVITFLCNASRGRRTSRSPYSTWR